MDVPRRSIGVLLLLIVAVGLGGHVVAADGDGIVSMQTEDLVIGEHEHQLGPTRIAGFSDSVRELVVEIDLAILESHGVDFSDAAVTLSAGHVDGGALQAATLDDGVVRIVIRPAESGLLIEPFRITGLETEGAEPATDIAYDATFSAGEADVDPFDIVDPTRTSPTVRPRTLWIDDGKQEVRIEGLRPGGGDVTIALDVSVLEDHGASLSGLEATVRTGGGTVQETAVQDGRVRIVVSPGTDQTLFDVVIELSGFGFEGVEIDDGTVASDVTYDARIEGAANDNPTVAPFDIIIGPLTAPLTGRSPTSAGGIGSMPGFGPVVALVGLIVGSLLAVRRR